MARGYIRAFDSEVKTRKQNDDEATKKKQLLVEQFIKRTKDIAQGNEDTDTSTSNYIVHKKKSNCKIDSRIKQLEEINKEQKADIANIKKSKYKISDELVRLKKEHKSSLKDLDKKNKDMQELKYKIEELEKCKDVWLREHQILIKTPTHTRCFRCE